MLQDKKADLLINTYVDNVLTKVMKKLGLEIPEYSHDIDPTKRLEDTVLDWTIKKEDIVEVKNLYNMYCKKHRKRKLDVKQIKSKKLSEVKQDAFINSDNFVKQKVEDA